ncbi:MAG: hypothetical protein ACQESD_00640 [Thermoplasmatota archaeon]
MDGRLNRYITGSDILATFSSLPWSVDERTADMLRINPGQNSIFNSPAYQKGEGSGWPTMVKSKTSMNKKKDTDINSQLNFLRVIRPFKLFTFTRTYFTAVI